jgi:phospholipid-binding lipoprotein MlaA
MEKIMQYSSAQIARTLFLLLLMLAAPPLQAQDDEDDFFFSDEEMLDGEIADPFEGLNRISFAVNDKLYRLLLSPVVKTYRLIPAPVRVSTSNFYDNLTAPVSSINALLQLDLPNAGSEISRFGINSTIGILGFFDPASLMGIEQDREDFGQTLGRWGFGHGFYLVVPVMGFSSFRDFGGRAAGSFLNPINHIWDPEVGEWLLYHSLDQINDFSFDVDTYTALYDSALDPYVFFRSAYVQNRAGAVDK